MCEYRTIQGDMWDMIAFRMYHNEQLMHVLIDANPQYRSVVVFPANCVLNIPDVSTEERIEFPLWRRNA